MVFSVGAATIIAARLLLSFWAEHSFTPVEAIVAAHAQMLAAGEGLYYDLNQYPYTVNPYGPIFYGLVAASVSIGLPALLAGRLISLAALLGVLYLAGRTAHLLTGDRYAAWTATLLAGTTANLLKFGNIGQTDSLALFFSIAAFYLFLRFDRQPSHGVLACSGLCIALAIFVKQSFLAAGAAVAILMLWRHGKTGFLFVATLGFSGVLVALGLNGLSGGGYFDHGIRSNLNPFILEILGRQSRYFLLVSGCLLMLAGAAPILQRRWTQLHLYLGLALAIFLLTSSKIGSEFNYQMEVTVLLCIAAAWSLHQLDFFGLCFRGDPGWITLLQLPLFLYCVLNIALSGRSLTTRAHMEHLQREQSAAMAPYLAPEAGRVLSVEIDPLLGTRDYIEVEPLIYSLLVDAGLVDPEPVLRDMIAGRFSTVVLYEDVFDETDPFRHPTMPSLPESHLEALRANYQLVERLDSPYSNGICLYQPKASALSMN